MNRQKKIEKIKSQSGRVSKISNLEVQHAHLHPDYLVTPREGILTETGNLEVLRIVPKSGKGPHFLARWDKREEHVDIDMFEAKKSAIRSFMNNRDGYSGHHTRRSVDRNNRIFHVSVVTPAGVIFQGTVSFSNTYEMIGAERITFTESFDAQIIRAGSKVVEGK